MKKLLKEKNKALPNRANDNITKLKSNFINENDLDIDYSDAVLRRIWRKRWYDLQTILTLYNDDGKPKNLRAKANTVSVSEETLNYLMQKNCFTDWVKDMSYTEIQGINHSQLIETYQKTGLIYDKFTKEKVRGFEEKIVLQKSKSKRIQLYKYPADTKWENIAIRFLNGQEVIIEVKNETKQTNFEEMGFQDEITKHPNKQWEFLQLLALKNGELSWENNKDLTTKQINNVKKQKQLLSENLKAYFQILEDPFYNYKKEKAYKIKINLIPESSE